MGFWNKACDLFDFRPDIYDKIEEEKYYTDDEILDILQHKNLTLASGNSLVLSLLFRYRDRIKKLEDRKGKL